MLPSPTALEPVPELSPELLQLLVGDPDDLVALCSSYQPADVAVALRRRGTLP